MDVLVRCLGVALRCPKKALANLVSHRANKDVVNDLVNALDDLVDENGVVEVDKYLSQDDFLKAQKLEAKKNRVAEQKRLRLQLMLEEANSKKSIDFTKSTHMKFAVERCGTNKRRYVDVLRPPIEEDTFEKVLSIDRLKKQNNVLDEFMIQMSLNLKPWKEDLKRPSKCIDKIYCNYYLEQFLITSGWSRCKFPWCTEIVVGRHFWDSLIGLDDERLGWLVDNVWYMWHFRQPFDDWSMVSCYFLTLLLQDSMPLFYATDEIYPVGNYRFDDTKEQHNETKRSKSTLWNSTSWLMVRVFVDSIARSRLAVNIAKYNFFKEFILLALGLSLCCCHDNMLSRFLLLLVIITTASIKVAYSSLLDEDKKGKKVIIPINEPKRHWSLAQFHIHCGNVTFYDSQKTYDLEFRPWYVRMRSCLESKLLVVLQLVCLPAKESVQPAIVLSLPMHKMSQSRVVCLVTVACLSAYFFTAHGIPLDVEDPVQTALAYREKMVQLVCM
ncbi:phospholipase-like protein [Tanacetum coccineum]